MSAINFGTTITLEQAAQLIVATPENRYLLQGEPGIGKSSLLKTIGEMTGYETAYIDVPNMDLGDVAMPVIDHETRTTTYYPNSRFKVHTGKPVCIMLDEFPKGMAPVQNMLHPLLEVANPRLGDVSINPKSYVFLTGNLASDGVGDRLKAHTRNRIVPLHIAKPTAKQWLKWAINNEIAPVVLGWVDRYPHVMASYTDPEGKDNPYIYQPTQVQTAFVSPRSLERASNIVRARDKIDTETPIAALSGAVGEAGARDLQAHIDYQDQLPAWDTIRSSPTTTPAPETMGACAVLVYTSIYRIDRDSITPFMKYLGRFAAEWQACFAVTMAKNPAKQRIAFNSPAFAEWCAKNEDLL